MKLTKHTAHRPYDLPRGPWVMAQTWSNLLFAHWPISPDVLRAKIPRGLELDTYDGQAWLGIVPFEMSGVRMRTLPPIPYTSAFPELNVRTYVTINNKPGVFFFSLDAANRLAVVTARRFFHLPYFNADMKVNISPVDEVHYHSVRTHKKANPSVFTGTYQPTSDVYNSKPGTLEHWLTERYCLYAVDHNGQIYRGDIHHLPWPLQKADAEITENTMAQAHGIHLPNSKPLLHFAKTIDVSVWPLSKVERQ